MTNVGSRSNQPLREDYGNLRLVSGAAEDGQLYCSLVIDNHIEVRQPGPGADLFLYQLDR